MSLRTKKHSNWREKIWKVYGVQASKEIRSVVEKEKFTVKGLAYDNAIPVIDHCSLSTRISRLTAICSELVQQKKLERIGQTYRFKR